MTTGRINQVAISDSFPWHARSTVAHRSALDLARGYRTISSPSNSLPAMKAKTSADAWALSITLSVRVSEDWPTIRGWAVRVSITSSASKLTTDCPAHRLDAAIRDGSLFNSCKLTLRLPITIVRTLTEQLKCKFATVPCLHRKEAITTNHCSRPNVHAPNDASSYWYSYNATSLKSLALLDCVHVKFNGPKTAQLVLPSTP